MLYFNVFCLMYFDLVTFTRPLNLKLPFFVIGQSKIKNNFLYCFPFKCLEMFQNYIVLCFVSFYDIVKFSFIIIRYNYIHIFQSFFPGYITRYYNVHEPLFLLFTSPGYLLCSGEKYPSENIDKSIFSNFMFGKSRKNFIAGCHFRIFSSSFWKRLSKQTDCHIIEK